MTMSATAPELPVSVEEYLDGELVAEVKHEYVNGRVYAMVGTSVVHNTVTLNLAVALRTAPKEPGCSVYVADVKARISTDDEDRFFYPDVMVACDDDEQDAYYRERPCLVVEVLSPSTERRDRADKFFAYRKLPSLQEYVLVAQDTQRVEVYRRDTQWELEIYGEGEQFELSCAGGAIAVADVYAGAEP